MIDQAHLLTLRSLCTRLTSHKIRWAITGSLGFALHGIAVTVHDIDVQTDREGAYLIERCFADRIVCPVALRTSERIQSHFGVLRVEGVEVEIMGDIQKRLPGGEWGEPPHLTEHTEYLSVDGMPVPVLTVEYEYTAYLQLGRTEQAQVLRAWLDRPGKP